jgi:hypothetical protein
MSGVRSATEAGCNGITAIIAMRPGCQERGIQDIAAIDPVMLKLPCIAEGDQGVFKRMELVNIDTEDCEDGEEGLYDIDTSVTVTL